MKPLMLGLLLFACSLAGQVALAQADAPSSPPPPAKPETPPGATQPRSPMLRPPTPQPGNVGGPGADRSKLKPVPQATLFNPDLNVKVAIEDAIKRGAAERRRVLIVWGHNGARWALRMQEALKVPETARQVRYHYTLVLADVAGSAFGPLNLALAQTYGAKFTQTANMKPFLTVLETIGDQAGQPIVNRSSEGMEKPGATRNDGSYNSAKILEFLAANRLPLLEGHEVVAAALDRARSRSVPMFVFFNDLEDPYCARFGAWLTRADVAPVLGKYFEVLPADYFRWAGGTAQYTRFGGDESEASPWYIIVDADEKRLAPDKALGELDLGFPTGDEIPMFLKMLKRVAPSLSDEDAKKIEESLESKPAADAAVKGG